MAVSFSLDDALAPLYHAFNTTSSSGESHREGGPRGMVREAAAEGVLR